MRHVGSINLEEKNNNLGNSKYNSLTNTRLNNIVHTCWKQNYIIIQNHPQRYKKIF